MIDDMCITPLTVRHYVARAFLRSVAILLTLIKRQLWFLFHVKDHGNFLSHFCCCFIKLVYGVFAFPARAIVCTFSSIFLDADVL